MFDAWQLINTKTETQGQCSATEVSRLAEAILALVNEVRYKVAGYRDNSHRPILWGVIEADVELECQRCLQPMEMTLTNEFTWVFVEHESESELAEEETGGTAFVLHESQPVPLAWIEDELLLSLPLVPMHDDNTFCAGRNFVVESRATLDSDRIHPFADLADFIKKKK